LVLDSDINTDMHNKSVKVECMSWLLGDFWISGQAMLVS